MVDSFVRSRIRRPISNEQGAVALLMMMLIFFGLILTSLIVDYSTYISASQEMKKAADRAVIKGGTQCMSSLLGSIQKQIASSHINPEITALIKKAMIDGEIEARKEFEYTLKELSASLKPGSFSVLAHPVSNKNFCIIELRYTVFAPIMTGRLLGMPTVTLAGKALAGATSSNPSGENLSVRIIE